MSQKTKSLLLQALPVVIIATLLVVAIIYAWTEPTILPPGGNVAAPINVGSSYQYKAGSLGLEGLRVFTSATFDGNVTVTTLTGAGAGCSAIETNASGNLLCGTDDPGAGVTSVGAGTGLTASPINPITDSGTISLDTSGISSNYITKWSGSKLVNSVIYDNGTNVGIGTDPGSNKLQVNGKIQAIGGDVCTDQGGGKCLSAIGGSSLVCTTRLINDIFGGGKTITCNTHCNNNGETCVSSYAEFTSPSGEPFVPPGHAVTCEESSVGGVPGGWWYALHSCRCCKIQ